MTAETLTDPAAQRTFYRLQVLKALIAGVPEVLDRYFHPDICILATRIGLEVLRYFDITDAYAQSVLCEVVNPEAAAMLDAGVTQEEVARVMWTRTREEPGGPWIMAIDPVKSSERRFPGHVGMVVPIRHADLHAMFVDLTANQFNRPHKGIDFGGPVVLQLEDDWPERQPTEPRTGALVNGSIIAYCPVADHPGPVSFTNSPDWLWPKDNGRRAMYRRVTGEAIRATRDHLIDSQRPFSP